jgi:glycosyltransferase involved in cell wall biosynthesis
MGKTLSRPRQRFIRGRQPSSQARAVSMTIGPLPSIDPSRELVDPVTISAICPTRNRARFHEGLYRTFQAQEHPHLELCVLDDSDGASNFFMGLRDPRVRYVHSRRMSLGQARNTLIAMSTGRVIAHFDDDDYYAPGYLTAMLARLRSTDSDLVKLSMWTEQDHRRRWVHDAHTKPEHDLWGWGFSYVYRKSVASRVSFPSISHAEDYAFVKGMWAAGLRTTLIQDGADWVRKRYADHPRVA